MLRQARISAPSSSQGHFSLPQEILGRSDCSESQPLVTNPRYGCSYRAGDGEEITPRAGLGPEERGYGGADCYGELPRILLLGTSVNHTVSLGNSVNNRIDPVDGRRRPRSLAYPVPCSSPQPPVVGFVLKVNITATHFVPVVRALEVLFV